MIYRFLKVCLVASTLALAFTSFTAVAQPQGGAQAPAQLDATQLAQLDAATTPAQLAAAVQALVANGAAPAALAGALSQRGQTLNQITTTLVQADVPAPQAAVAVRIAVPGATSTSVAAALLAAGVSLAERRVAARAVLRVVSQVQQQSTTPAAVASVTGAGLLVGADGQAVTVRNREEQLLAVAAFVSGSLQNNPNSLSDPNLRAGLSNIIRDNPGRVGIAGQNAFRLIQDALNRVAGGGTTLEDVFPGVAPTPTPTPVPPEPTPTPPPPYVA